MKKALSLILCYAVGMVASVYDAAAAVSSLDSAINFSNSSLWGKTPRSRLDDFGIYPSQNLSYWYYAGTFGNQSLITNYSGAAERAARYKGFSLTSNPCPDYMKPGDENEGYLKFRAVQPLARTFAAVDEFGDSSQILVPSDNDLFVDALVQFHPRLEAATEIPAAEVKDLAKFMCWLSAPAGSATTNLIVTAGRFSADGLLYRTNYVTTATVVPGRWYRLTARAIANATTQSGASVMCFALYLDGKRVACGDDYAIGDNAARMAAWFAGNEHYLAKGLFPSILALSGSSPALYGMAFQGTGAVDEIGVVNEGNPLAVQASRLGVTVAAEADKVTNIVCAVKAAGATEPYLSITNVPGSGELSFVVNMGDSVTVTALTEQGYALDPELKFSGNVAALADHSGLAFTMVATKFDSADKLVARINLNNLNFRVGDRSFESIKEALAAAVADPSRMLKMVSDVTLDPTTENGQMHVLPSYDLTFDLNGRTLVGRHFMDEATIYDQGRLTVVDSVGGGAIIAPGTAIEVVSTNDALEVNHAYASLTLGSTTVTGQFTVKGRVRRTRGELFLRGGKYLTPSDLEPTNGFYLAEYVDGARFSVLGPEPSGEGNYWSVGYDGRLLVRFSSSVGTVSPAYTNVTTGSKLLPPRFSAPGYTMNGWLNLATGNLWNFAEDVVESELTLAAQTQLDNYLITYDSQVSPSAPILYSVVSERRALPASSKNYFTFTGWRDSNSGERVDQVGAGAVFVGTETTVTGNLALVAQWLPQEITWSNTSGTHSESNGTYSGTWTFVIPPRTGIERGTRVTIDEIAFGIVNPLLYPKTAAYLAVTPKDGSPVVSAARTYDIDVPTQEYLVGTNRLANGRAKVGYRFSGLTVKAGETNEVRFSSTSATVTPTSGFLRLRLMSDGTDPVFGNCTEAGGQPASEEYLRYCPVYEVRGRMEGSN